MVLLTFPLGTTTVWIHVCLNESNVTLHNRADVLYPVPGTLLVSFDGTAPESDVTKTSLDCDEPRSQYARTMQYIPQSSHPGARWRHIFSPRSHH
jgi:hypothetical protein